MPCSWLHCQPLNLQPQLVKTSTSGWTSATGPGPATSAGRLPAEGRATLRANRAILAPNTPRAPTGRGRPWPGPARCWVSRLRDEIWGAAGLACWGCGRPCRAGIFFIHPHTAPSSLPSLLLPCASLWCHRRFPRRQLAQRFVCWHGQRDGVPRHVQARLRRVVQCHMLGHGVAGRPGVMHAPTPA